jgi:hypothetical protein
MDGGTAEAADTGTTKRRKRSRWEEAEKPSTAIVVAAPAGTSIGSFTFPKEVMLSMGLKVRFRARRCQSLK